MLPPGKILSAEPTAPMGNYSTPFPTVIDAVIKALEQALPERVPGGHFGTHSGVRFHGRRADGTFFGTHDSGHGGWGACATHDGSGPFRTMAHGDTRIIPLELQETYLPLRIEEFSLRADSGGAGKFRGGLGFRKSYRMLSDCGLQTNLDRTKFPPWGVQGGKEASPGRFTVVDGRTGTERAIEKEKGFRLAANDLVCVETGGGGGYGPPQERSLDLIQRDLDAGYVTAAAAQRDYGDHDRRRRERRDDEACVRAYRIMQTAIAALRSDEAKRQLLDLRCTIRCRRLPAETVEEFYRGKTITIYVGTGVGAGAVSAYPMAMMQVIKKYIPGNPNIMLSYMPGAGGIKAATYIEIDRAAGRHRGRGFITRGFMLAPLLKLPQANFHPAQVQLDRQPGAHASRWAWSGTPRPMCAPSRSAMQKEVVVGATSHRAGHRHFPRALNRVAGTKFKIVTGYPGSGAVDIAIERGEVQGKVGSTWKSLNSGASRRLGAEQARHAVSCSSGVKKAPDIPATSRSVSISPRRRRTGRRWKCCTRRAPPAIRSSWARAFRKERVEAIPRRLCADVEGPRIHRGCAQARPARHRSDQRRGNRRHVVRGIYALPAAAVERARDFLPALVTRAARLRSLI